MLNDQTSQRDADLAVAAEASAPLILIQDGEKDPPLICIHPIGGSIFSYADLALQLSEDWTVYGIQAPILREETREVSSIAELARFYDRFIAEAGIGDFVVCGWSLGGLIALEIARCAAERTGTFPQLIVLDSSLAPPPGCPADTSQREAWVWAQFATMSLGEDGATSLTGSGAFWDCDDEGRLAAIYRLARANNSRFLPRCSTPQVLARRFGFFRAQILARQDYRPETYPGPVSLIRTRQPSSLDLQQEWEAIASGRLTTHPVGGEHVSMMHPPHLTDVGRAVETILAAESAARDR